jgi:predicted PurR-regulated permease PerM
MLIQFTLQELMLFLISALAIVVGILLLPILWHIKKVVGSLRSLIEDNQEIINTNIKTMPEILDNAGQVSRNLRVTTDQLRTSFPVILQEVEYVTNTAKGSLETASATMEHMGFGRERDTPAIMDYIHIFEELVQIIYRIFSSKK